MQSTLPEAGSPAPVALPEDLPRRPVPPPARMMLETIAGPLWFDSEEEMRAWKAEPWWRKLTGTTAYDRRLKADSHARRQR